MSPIQRFAQIACFVALPIIFWAGVVPLTLSTFEWIFNIGDVRKRGRP